MRNVLISIHLLGFMLSVAGLLFFGLLITTLYDPALVWGGLGLSCYLFYMSGMQLERLYTEIRAERLNPVAETKPPAEEDTQAPKPFNQDVLEVPSSRGHVEIDGVRFPVTDYHITMRRQLYGGPEQ